VLLWVFYVIIGIVVSVSMRFEDSTETALNF
jgi:hypothetical protein